MDRNINFAGQVPLETDLLKTNQFAMVGLAKLSEALMGTGGVARGFATSQTVVPSLAVLVGAGEVYSQENLEATAFSSLPQDLTHSIVKQGLMLDAVTLPVSAPATAGFSINYLVQVDYQDDDSGSTVLPYYNASNPSTAYSGPANSGAAQPTLRKGAAIVSLKAGSAATTGTQATPAPDAGKIGMYVVTVANGASTVVNANISLYPGFRALRKTFANLQDEIATLIESAGLTLDPNATNQVLAAIRSLSSGSPRVNGLVGAPTSTTQMQLSAAFVRFRDVSGASTPTVSAIAAITNNISTAGPIANGRDQSAAFSTGAWVHYFFIWNGATVATIASLSATAPTLPAGYTHYAYAATMLMGASILTPMRYRGDKAFYDAGIQCLSGAGNQAETAVPVSTTVPPNAVTMLLMVNMGLSTNASGAAGSNLGLRHITGSNFLNITSSVAVANQTAWNSAEVELPNNSQNFYFLFFNETSPVNLSVRQAFINTLGFTIPNGG